MAGAGCAGAPTHTGTLRTSAHSADVDWELEVRLPPSDISQRPSEAGELVTVRLATAQDALRGRPGLTCTGAQGRAEPATASAGSHKQ